MSAKKPLKALIRILHTRGPGARAVIRRLARAAVSGAMLLALSLCLAGCGDLQPASKARLIPPPRTDPGGGHAVASTTQPPEPRSRPAPPVPQQTKSATETHAFPASVSESKSLPATTGKGAENLMAHHAPAPVKASERATVPQEPPVLNAPRGEAAGSGTDAPVQALILKGAPPPERPVRAGRKRWLWLGLGLGVVAAVVLARSYAAGRAKPVEPAEAVNDDLKAAPGLLMKEPLNLPPETVMADGP